LSAGPDQEFEPARPLSLSAGFGPAKKITFRNNADEFPGLVDDW
jgi:hypothetical protein